jgi:hypothetical protein
MKRSWLMTIFLGLLLHGIIRYALNTYGTTPLLPKLIPSKQTVPTLPLLPEKKVLVNDYHIFQTFNNCGPASLSMALSYFGIHETQQTLGQAIRPYQIASGDNDDKSVTMDELAYKAREYGLLTYHRPNGDITLLKQFITHGIPVITRTWLHVHEDIGHYRIVKGYDETTQEIIQDDSFENKNLRYSYADFLSMWSKYNYEYLVLVPSDKQQLAESILGENVDFLTAWKHALENAQTEAARHPDDMYVEFNVSVAAYYAEDYKQSIAAYEKVADKLPFRTLWYQIEPIQAYYELGEYDKVFAITDKVLNNQNRAFSEFYLIRGNIYKKQGKLEEAKQEYENAVKYNVNLKAAKDALASI